MATLKSNGVEENAEEALEQGKEALESASHSTWLDRTARWGYAVRGILYGLIGLISIRVAVGGSSQAVDQPGALAAIGAEPFGRVLLILVVVGLAGYSLWGLIRAVLDPLHKGSDLSGTVQRVGYLASAISYAALIFPTLRFIIGNHNAIYNGAQGVFARRITSTFLNIPLGTLIIGLAGMVFLGVGAFHVIKAFRDNFDAFFHPYKLSPRQLRWAKFLGRYGSLARGVVFALIGLFLVISAVTQNSSKAQGIDGSLLAISRAPAGEALLLVVAFGLISFGVYSTTNALWLKIK